MGRIVISVNTTLDGVVQDPDGKEGSTSGGWFAESGGADLDAWFEVMTAEALNAEALLLGRRSDEWFGRRWPSRTGKLADRLNSLPKYVVSSRLEHPVWTNATVIGGDEVARLKRQVDGEILVYASGRLSRTLLTDGLVDELRLVVFPVVLGAGRRLFDETGGKTSLRLLKSEPIGAHLVVLTYVTRDR
jgi:dihydrofolate reductase